MPTAPVDIRHPADLIWPVPEEIRGLWEFAVYRRFEGMCLNDGRLNVSNFSFRRSEPISRFLPFLGRKERTTKIKTGKMAASFRVDFAEDYISRRLSPWFEEVDEILGAKQSVFHIEMRADTPRFHVSVSSVQNVIAEEFAGILASGRDLPKHYGLDPLINLTKLEEYAGRWLDAEAPHCREWDRSCWNFRRLFNLAKVHCDIPMPTAHEIARAARGARPA